MGISHSQMLTRRRRKQTARKRLAREAKRAKKLREQAVHAPGAKADGGTLPVSPAPATR